MPRSKRNANSTENVCARPVAAVAADQRKKPPAMTQFDVHSVYQPAGYGLQTRVRPEECREQNSQLRCRDSQLVLQHRSSDREIATIYIVYEDGDSEQDENRRELARESLALWHRKRLHEDGVILSAFTDFCNSICWNGVWRARGDGPSSRFRVSSQRNRKQHQDCWRNIPISLIDLDFWHTAESRHHDDRNVWADLSQCRRYDFATGCFGVTVRDDGVDWVQSK